MKINQVLRERVRNRGLKTFWTSEYEWTGKLDSGTQEYCFMAFPYFQGNTLADLIADKGSKTLTDTEILGELNTICSSLMKTGPNAPLFDTTSVRLEHGALHPANILVDKDHKFYITDFGDSSAFLWEDGHYVFYSHRSVEFERIVSRTKLDYIVNPLAEMIKKTREFNLHF